MKRLALLLLLPFIVATSAVGEVNWPDALKGVATGDQAWLNKTPEPRPRQMLSRPLN